MDFCEDELGRFVTQRATHVQRRGGVSGLFSFVWEVKNRNFLPGEKTVVTIYKLREAQAPTLFFAPGEDGKKGLVFRKSKGEN